jgi:ABC-type multidrug transport system fused ATPase/permease subunit
MAIPGLLENRRWRGLALVSLLTLAQGTAAGAAALATRALFEGMHAGASPGTRWLALLAASGLVIAAVRVAARLTGERLGQDFALSIRMALLNHAAGMPASAVAARRSGYMSLRFVGDMTAFRNWLGKGLPRLIAGIVMIPSACAVLWWLEPHFALAVSPLFAATLAVQVLAGPRLEPLHRRLRARRARIAAEMAERMPLAPELDRMGRRPTELRSLHKRTQRMIRAGLQRLFWAETLKALPDAVAGLAACAVIVVGAQAGTSTGTIAGALAAIGLVLMPLRDLASVWNFRAAYLAAQGKCAAALEREQRGVCDGDKRLPEGPVALCVRGLPVPQAGLISQSIPAGGRETLTCDPRSADALFAALYGLEHVQPGKITLSGICLTELTRGSLWRGVHRLDTRPIVLKGSLRRNLALGLRQRPSDDRLEQVARRAGLGDLLQRLGSLEGTLAEGGRDLSVQEGSALSLARVLLGKPQLILIGEALWHLDVAAQAVLAAHLAESPATVLRHPVLACPSSNKMASDVV